MSGNLPQKTKPRDVGASAGLLTNKQDVVAVANDDIPSQCLTCKYQLMPNKRQHAALQRILDDQRFLYNSALEQRINAYRTSGKSLTYVDQCKELTQVRGQVEGWSDYPAVLQRGTLKRLDNAFQGFFRRVKRGDKPGFPRFKGHGWFTSFEFTEFMGIRFDGKRIRFKGLPGGLRVHLHRPLPEGKILAAKFKRDGKGWSVCFVVRVPCDTGRTESRSIGIDMGITTLAMLSNGEAIPNPKAARIAHRELRRRQRALARCKKGSNRRNKVRQSLAKCHKRIRNTRNTHLHQASAKLVKDYDLIAIEALNVKGLAKGILARDVNDAAWGKFTEMLCYKAWKAGVRLIEVDPRNTSQACSGCGSIVPKKLSERWHCCPHCGLEMDRDHNAAINVLHRAVLRPGLPNVSQWAERATGNITLVGSK